MACVYTKQYSNKLYRFKLTYPSEFDGTTKEYISIAHNIKEFIDSFKSSHPKAKYNQSDAERVEDVSGYSGTK